jgi:hypothetical protein
MKKIISALLIAAMILSFSLTASASEFTTADALAILRASVGLSALSAEQSAKFGISGNPTTADALKILRQSVGLPATQPSAVGAWQFSHAIRGGRTLTIEESVLNVFFTDGNPICCCGENNLDSLRENERFLGDIEFLQNFKPEFKDDGIVSRPFARFTFSGPIIEIHESPYTQSGNRITIITHAGTEFESTDDRWSISADGTQLILNTSPGRPANQVRIFTRV